MRFRFLVLSVGLGGASGAGSLAAPERGNRALHISTAAMATDGLACRARSFNLFRSPQIGFRETHAFFRTCHLTLVPFC